MCERLVNTIHCLTFRQKKSEPSKAAGAGVAAASEADASETDREEAISTQGKLIKIQSFDQWPKPKPVGPAHGQAEKPNRSHSINKKVDDFIARTKMKIRSVSGVAVERNPP